MNCTSKSSEKSDRLRDEGNRFYAQKMFYDAMLKYNESLCFAELDSEKLGLAYANRSAIYFEMKLYDNCLNNIAMAKKNRYPENNFEILDKRAIRCDEMKKQNSAVVRSPEVTNLIKLSYPANNKISFIVDCLEMKVDKNFGRHIITNRALKVGDIVAIEDPFCKIIHEPFIYQRCTGCFKDSLMDLIPCERCVKSKKLFLTRS